MIRFIREIFLEGIDLKEETLEGNTDNTNLMVVDS